MEEYKTIEYKGVKFEINIQSSGTSIWVQIAGATSNGKAVICDDPYRDKPYYHIKNGSPLLLGYPDIEDFHIRFYSIQAAIFSACDDLMERPSEAEIEKKKEKAKSMLNEAWGTIDVDIEFREGRYRR